MIWHDAKNYVRFERRVWWLQNQGKYASPPAIPEYFKNGKSQQWQSVNKPEFLKGQSTWLELERRGDKLIAAVSHDGKNWTGTTQITVSLPESVWVGVLAINTSVKPMVVEFEELKIGASMADARQASELKTVVPSRQVKRAAAQPNDFNARRFMLGMVGFYAFPVLLFLMCAVTMFVCLIKRNTREWFRLAGRARREHREMLKSLRD